MCYCSEVIRKVEFAGPNNESVTRFALEPLLRAWFAMLAPDRTLSQTRTSPAERKYNLGSDDAYRTLEGDGILISRRHFGAVPGDGIETEYEVDVGEIGLVVIQQNDSTQDTLVFEISATPETIDVATDALLQVAAAKGLVLVQP